MDDRMQVRRNSLLVLLAFASASVHAQQKLLAFDTPTTSKTLRMVNEYGRDCWGDVDGDGDVDAVFTRAISFPGFYGFYVFLNSGTGRLVPDAIVPKHHAGDLYGPEFQLADLDGDGDLDLIAPAINRFLSKIVAVRLFENDGKGRFAPSAKFSVPTPKVREEPYSVGVGDLDGDGDNDIVYGDFHFLWNDGKGVFTRKDLIPRSVKNTVVPIRLHDFNSDGRLDIFFGVYGRPSEVWINDGSGGYKSYWFSNLHRPFDARFAPITARGRLDLVVNDFALNGMVVYRQTSTGWTLLPQVLQISNVATEFSVGDIDGDGKSEIVANGLPGSIHLFSYSSQGRMENVTDKLFVKTSWLPLQVFLGFDVKDLDGDGDLDVGGLFTDGITGLTHGRVVRNRFRHIVSPRTAKLGSTFDLTMFGADQHTFLLAVSLRETYFPLGDLGALRIDPALMVLLPGRTLRNRKRESWSFPVPQDPNLVGVELYFQALDVGKTLAPRLTGLMRTLIVK